MTAIGTGYGASFLGPLLKRYSKISRVHCSTIRVKYNVEQLMLMCVSKYFFSFRARPEIFPPIVCVKNNITTANLSRRFIMFHHGRTFLPAWNPLILKVSKTRHKYSVPWRRTLYGDNSRSYGGPRDVTIRVARTAVLAWSTVFAV